eukprot:m.61524 g.61524  ORF g.61524 m.61524 type:complete len:478 (+) comp13346_c0_seq1:1322-2755(+)
MWREDVIASFLCIYFFPVIASLVLSLLLPAVDIMALLSDEDLSAIFDRLDEDKKGYISLDTLHAFAKQSGLNDIGQLDVLDYDNTGKITFTSFAKGVRTLQGQIPETPRIGRRRRHTAPAVPALVLSDDSADEDHNASDILHEENVFTPSTYQGSDSDIAITPDFKVTRSLPAGTYATHRFHRQIEEQEQLITQLRNELDVMRAERDHDRNVIADLDLLCKQLKRSCTDYEQQLNNVEEQLEHSRVEELEASCTQLRREKEELQRDLRARCLELEDNVLQLTTERNRLKEDNEVLRVTVREEQNLTKQLRLAIIDLKESIAQLETERDQALMEARESGAMLLETSLSQQANKYQLEMDALESQLETLTFTHQAEVKDLESQRQNFELELQQAHQDYETLERKHRELERKLIQQGMDLAAAPARDEESLAAQMSTASRETLIQDLAAQEEKIRQLQLYISHLLGHVIEKIPEILEIKR